MTIKPATLFSMAFLFIIIFLCSVTGLQASGLNGPDEFYSAKKNSAPADDSFSILDTVKSPLRSLLLAGLKVYRNGVSDIGGSRCGMYPSCSAYAAQAVKKHGGFIGMAMTADRLMHEAEELESGSLVNKGEKILVYDPVGNNDFWWYKEKKE